MVGCASFMAALFLLAAPVPAHAVAPIPDADRALLKEVVRDCGPHEFADERIADLPSRRIAVLEQSSGLATYRPETWRAVIAAVKKFKELGLVVTDHMYADRSLRDQVLTAEEFARRAPNPARIICSGGSPIESCDKDTEARLADALNVDLCDRMDRGDCDCGPQSRLQDQRRNALRGTYSRILKTLWERGYDYDGAEWSEGSANPPAVRSDGK